jgi:hypothetical protein
MRVYFVVSCGRSGSTSLAKILNGAANGVCLSEPAPGLNVETRDMMDGRLADPDAALERTILPRVREAEGTVDVYGEKHINYGPFIGRLYERLRCQFIFIRRDGRDVVRSLMDWHNLKFGTIYREAADVGGESPAALAAAAALPINLDTSDYSRPRPTPGDPLYPAWENLTRFEMCAYYWAQINRLYLNELIRLPADAWTEIDYSRPNPHEVCRVAEFVGLSGLSEPAVGKLLDARINSIAYRRVVEGGAGPEAAATEPAASFPRWRDWGPDLTARFDRLAGPVMRQFGYVANPV